MKFHIEIDCTPEEVRRFMGLPDLAPLHESYQNQMKDMMGKGITPDMVETMVKSWSPLGQNGLDLLRSVMAPFADSKQGDTKDSNQRPDRKS
jgi:hypothetical protein